MVLQHLPLLNSLRIVLASGSPRRLSILQGVGLTSVEQHTSTFEENLDKAAFANGGAYALSTARRKAEDVHARLSSSRGENRPVDVLIAADTVVAFPADPSTADPLILIEKADSAAHAKAILRQLSGRSHEVRTGLVLGYASATLGQWVWQELTARTVVSVAPLSDDLIDAYVNGFPQAWSGKAGAYGIQDLAGSFITGIEGDYYNVMGLPLHTLCAAVSQLVESGELVGPREVRS